VVLSIPLVKPDKWDLYLEKEEIANVNLGGKITIEK